MTNTIPNGTRPLNDEGPDDLDVFLEDMSADPSFRSAYEDAGCRAGLIRFLASCRSAEAVSQAAVAALMGTTQSAVSELEGGVTDPRLSTLQRYARSVGWRILLDAVPDQQQCRYSAVETATYVADVVALKPGTARLSPSFALTESQAHVNGGTWSQYAPGAGATTLAQAL